MKIKNTSTYFKKHKIQAALVLVVLLGLIYGGYKVFGSSSTATRYVLGEVKRGTITTSVTGSGQVSASNQVELKSKASGDIAVLAVKNGQRVTAGQLIAQVDTRDARLALESAELAYQKLVKPADVVSITQAKNNVAQAYSDALRTLSTSFIDFQTIVTGLDTLLNNYQTGALNDNAVRNYGDAAMSLRTEAINTFYVAQRSYTTALQHYSSLTRTSDNTQIEAALAETYDTSRQIAEAVKKTKNVLDFIRSQQSAANTNETTNLASANTNLTNWSTTSTTDVGNLLSTQNSIRESTQSLTKLEEGADPLDEASQQLSLREKQYAYEDYFVRAPFAGTIGTLNITPTDTVSNGTVIATLVSDQKIAEISLNEVDVAKIHVGDKTKVTFDAIENLTIEGKVAEVDQVGSVSQGVVTYNVKISFDTQDERVKSGMSVSTEIITQTKSGVITVPNSAVKTQGNTHYVEVFAAKLANATKAREVTSTTAPGRKTVEVGLSNDTLTEITSGLNVGDQIVLKTTSGTTSAATTRSTTPSLFPTGNRTTGNTTRFAR